MTIVLRWVPIAASSLRLIRNGIGLRLVHFRNRNPNPQSYKALLISYMYKRRAQDYSLALRRFRDTKWPGGPSSIARRPGTEV